MTLNNDVFHAEGGDPADVSLSKEFFAEVTKENQSWRSPSAPNFDLMPLQFMSLVECHQNWNLLRARFLSLLPTTGSLLFNKDTMLHGIVLKATEAGVLLWRVHATTIGSSGSKVLVYPLQDDHVAGGPKFEHVVITAHEPWYCCSVQGVAPKRLQKLLGSEAVAQIPCAVVGMKNSKKESLLRYACRKGFVNLTVPRMKQLWRHLGKSERSAPANTKELLVGLAGQILGEGNFSLETLLAEREKKQYIEIPTPLNKEMLEQCADAFSAEDFKEVFDAAPSAPESKTETGSSSAAPPALKKRWPLPTGKSEYDEEDVRPLLPQDIEVRLYREMRWHTRWRVLFPSLSQPNFVSRSFGGLCSEEHAVKKLVKAAWALYQREGGPPCPWQFP